MSDAFGMHIEAVARACLGEPNKALSSAKELRFGTNGSMSVDLEKGVWADHEANNGGGVLDLLVREGWANDHGAAAKLLKDDFGAELPDERRDEPKREPPKIVDTYDYVDEHGEVLFQVVRYFPKTFKQRRPEGQGWSWSVKGIRQVPYNLPAVLKAPKARVVFVAEGEKDVNSLTKLGVLATCNAGGAGKWPDGMSEHFAGRDVVILPHNDDAGVKHSHLVAAAMAGQAKRVRVLSLPGLGAKGDATDWIEAGGTKAELVALAEAIPDYIAPVVPVHPVSAFGAIHWSELDQHATRADWLVEDLFFQGNAGMIYGASGSGKSFMAVDLGLAVARGVPFLGKRTAQGGVLYQAGEGGAGLVKRLKAYRLEHRIADPTIPFVLLTDEVNLFDGEDIEPFVAECEMQAAAMAVPLRAIVIDTFSVASAGANENASEDVGRVLAAGKRLQKSTGACVIWVHHKNANGDRERGHTSIRANLDFAIEVVRDEDGPRRTATLVKLKDGEDGVKLGFELQRVVLEMDEHGKEVSSCVVVPAETPVADAAKFKLPPGPVKYLRALDQAIARRGGQLPMLDGIPERQVGVEMGAFREIYRAMHGDGKDTSAMRQAMSRDGDKLVELGLIGRWEGYAWITRKGELWL